jgi:hypothetical protein
MLLSRVAISIRSIARCFAKGKKGIVPPGLTPGLEHGAGLHVAKPAQVSTEWHYSPFPAPRGEKQRRPTRTAADVAPPGPAAQPAGGGQGAAGGGGHRRVGAGDAVERAGRTGPERSGRSWLIWLRRGFGSSDRPLTPTGRR